VPNLHSRWLLQRLLHSGGAARVHVGNLELI